MSSLELDMSGRTAVVTGGAKRIGRVICLTLAEAGANVIVHCNKSVVDAQQVITDIEGLGGRGSLVQGDLTTDVAAICSAIADSALTVERGGLDLLVNSASIFERSRFSEISESDIDRMLKINTIAPFMLAQGLLADLQSVNGSIINVLDTSLTRPWPFYSHYCSSKAALAAITKSLASELAPEVRVNAVAPGAIMFSSAESESQRQRIITKIPMGRIGTPEELAQTILFLAAGPEYITGQVIAVDGGWSLSEY